MFGSSSSAKKDSDKSDYNLKKNDSISSSKSAQK